MKRLVGKLVLLLVAKLARRQGWQLVRRTAGRQIKQRSRRLARALTRRTMARIVHKSAGAISKSPLRHTYVGERMVRNLFSLSAHLRQD